MSDYKYSVYMHKSPSNKVYIGITRMAPKKRWQNGLGYRRNDYFYRAILKYGWNNFTHEILFEGLSESEASSKERELIALYKSSDKRYGYNLTSGGEVGKIYNEEARQRISERNKEHRHSEETKRLMSERQKGDKAYWYGKKMPIEARRKLSESKKGRPALNRKCICQFDSEMNLIGEYASVTEAVAKTNVPSASISIFARNGRMSHGYYWRYKEDLCQKR